MKILLSKKYLDEVKERCNSASDAPWQPVFADQDLKKRVVRCIMRGFSGSKNAFYLLNSSLPDHEFIANSWQDFLLLLMEIERFFVSQVKPVLSVEYLEEIKIRCETSSPGPWVFSIEDFECAPGSQNFISHGPKSSEEKFYFMNATEADLVFISKAREDIPLLLSEDLKWRSGEHNTITKNDLEEDDLEEFKKRINAVSEGPWSTIPDGVDDARFIRSGGGDTAQEFYLRNASEGDFLFIAHAREDIPRLLEELERLEKDKSPILTREYLNEIQKRWEATTPGEWASLIEGRDFPLGGSSYIKRGDSADIDDLCISSITDQDFVGSSKNDVALLLKEVERLRNLLGYDI